MTFGDTARLDSTTGPRLQVEVAIPDGPAPVRITLSGELDGDEVPGLTKALAELPPAGDHRDIHIDAGALTFLDSAGIRALVVFRERAAEAGSRVIMVALTTIVYRVLEITDLLDHFGIRP